MQQHNDKQQDKKKNKKNISRITKYLDIHLHLTLQRKQIEVFERKIDKNAEYNCNFNTAFNIFM